MTPSLRTSLRSWIAALIFVVASAGVVRTAAAQTGTGGFGGTTTSTLTADDFVTAIQSPQGASLLDFDLQRFFNVKNCECETPVFPFFALSASGLAKRSTIPQGTIQFKLGYLCDQPAVANCISLGDAIPLTTFANTGSATLTSSAKALSAYFGQPVTTTVDGDGGVTTPTPVPAGGDICQAGIAFPQVLYALITYSTTPATAYDLVITKQISIDLAPPPPPTNLAVEPGNEALIASWTTVNTANTPDLLGYQILCDRGGALQVFKTGTFGAQFKTCPGFPPPPTTGNDININGLDENYACSGLLSPDTGSFRIKILENGVPYGAAVVAIDQSFNASQPTVVYGVPIKTLSFYDVYRNGDSMVQPGGASGGLCAVPAGPIKMTRLASVVSLSGVGLGLVVLGLRRRRRRGP